MKTTKRVKVTELKANLSKYLRMAQKGATIVVTDRDEAIARLSPLEAEPVSWRERLAGEGRLILGTQDWGSLVITPLDKKIDVQALLDDIRADPSESR
jgi:antitoxin (DNA-binding transcriptional repressor) of toxin-antitoxin stability system